MPGWSAWLLLHFGLAAALTWGARRYALCRRLLDEPGERRSHTVATPRGGGIAIVACLLVAAAVAWTRPDAISPFLVAFAVGLVLVAGIGWWDDHRPLSPALRFVVQNIAALVLAWGIYQIDSNPWLAGLTFALTLVLVNVWNFMDGINGLAASQAAIAALAYAMVGSGVGTLLATALLAACLGFLPFNYPRARIFLGDVGSGALGYALAALWAISSGGREISMLIFLLPLTILLVDAGFTLATRMLAGERWWTPHITHVYQLAAKRYGHTAITCAYGALSLITLMMMLISSRSSMYTAVLTLAAGYAAAGGIWLGVRRRMEPNKRADDA